MKRHNFVFLLALALFGCVFADPAYSPSVKNESHFPVRIVLEWEVGPDQPGYLPPGAACVQGVKNRRLSGISVESEEGWSRKYGRSFLARLRAGRSLTAEVWIIGDRSLSLE